MLEYRDRDQVWRRVSLGSGFLLSSDGLFVTAYHVMKYCLATRRETSGLSVKVDCSTVRPEFRYIAENEGREFAIEVTSYLREADSTNGKEKHTPDEILKQKDFVVAKLKTTRRERFSYWRLQDFDNKRIESANPKADFSLTPLLPPKRVFIAGFPSDHNFVISEGFLNLTERYNRGYFAADLNVYTIPYLESQGVDADTNRRVEKRVASLHRVNRVDSTLFGRAGWLARTGRTRRTRRALNRVDGVEGELEHAAEPRGEARVEPVERAEVGATHEAPIHHLGRIGNRWGVQPAHVHVIELPLPAPVRGPRRDRKEDEADRGVVIIDLV